MTDGELILIAGTLLVAALGASLAAARLRVPALLLFLGVGMAVGSDGAGWIDFNDYSLARRIGTIALALISLTLTLIWLLDNWMPLELAALILTIVWAAIAGVLALRGRTELKQMNPVEGVTPSDPLLEEMLQMYNDAPTPYLKLVDFRYGEPRDLAQRPFVVERRGQQPARLGKEPERALGVHDGALALLGARHQAAPPVARSSSMSSTDTCIAPR